MSLKDKIREWLWHAQQLPPRSIPKAIGYTIQALFWVLLALVIGIFVDSMVAKLLLCVFLLGLALAALYDAEWHVRLLRRYFARNPYGPLKAAARRSQDSTQTSNRGF